MLGILRRLLQWKSTPLAVRTSEPTRQEYLAMKPEDRIPALQAYLRGIDLYGYLRRVKDGTISEVERRAYLDEHGRAVAEYTPGTMRCGNPACGCRQLELPVSHHMYWVG